MKTRLLPFLTLAALATLPDVAAAQATASTKSAEMHQVKIAVQFVTVPESKENEGVQVLLTEGSTAEGLLAARMKDGARMSQIALQTTMIQDVPVSTSQADSIPFVTTKNGKPQTNFVPVTNSISVTPHFNADGTIRLNLTILRSEVQRPDATQDGPPNVVSQSTSTLRTFTAAGPLSSAAPRRAHRRAKLTAHGSGEQSCSSSSLRPFFPTPPRSRNTEEHSMTIKDDEQVDIPTPTGPMRTYLFRPAAEGRYPGLLLYSEIFQATGPVRRTAAMLAGHGFAVAVPEIYHELEPAGTVLAYDTEGAERGNAHKIAKELSSYDSDARAALDYLKTDPHCTGSLGVAGICIGGHLAFRAAMNPDVLAGTCFYATDIHKRGLGKGTNDDTLDRMGEIKGEMLMVWGRQDPHVPREGRRLVYDAMTDAGVNFQWHEFNAAHAFLRDEGPRYDPAMARVCYGMALELFGRKLGEGDASATSAGPGTGEARH